MFALVCLLFLFNSVYGLYEKADVVHLNVDNFDRLVTGGADTWVVQFYSPYCPYCQEFAPSFEKAATILKGSHVKVGVVDADEDKTLLRRYEIKGIPNVKIYHPKNPVPETYTGPRTTDALVQKVTALKKGRKANKGEIEDSNDVDNIDDDEELKPTEPITKIKL
nr:protein disulfide-isomerase A6-like [Onthophagus taurus]